MHTVQRYALNLGHLYAHRAEVCLESEARLCTPCIGLPQFWGKVFKFWDGLPRL